MSLLCNISRKEHVWLVGSMPGVFPQAKSILLAQCAFKHQQRKCASVAGLKGTEGPCSDGSESFKVKAEHLVSVLIDHKHIISPVQGLICPLNQHLLSTAAVLCWEGGYERNSKGLIIPGRCKSVPIFCSLLSCLLVDFEFSDMCSLNIEGFGGFSLWKEKTFSEIYQKWKMLLWK